MKSLIAVLFVSMLPGILPAQTPVTSLQTFASSADVQALIAKARSERKDGQAIVAEKILQFAPYSANLEYRASAGPAAVHEKEAEMMFVIDGSATLVTGGKLTGATIQGGESRKISKGDFLVVPENTPHQISAVEGAVVLMTIKIPRGGASAP